MAESSTPSRKIQNLRSFTVQIRHFKTNATVGTGFVVSEDGLIATCAHVVVAAGVNPRFGKIPSHWELIRQSFFRSSEALQTGTTATLPVYFPQAKQLPIAERTRYATVVGCFSDSDDDLVLLKLTEATLPEGVEVALVDRADESVNVADERRFRSYGYRRLDKYQGLQADGFILGTVEPPSDRTVLLDPIQLRSPEIDSGMSGAAVLNVVRDRVVGIIAETADIRTGTDRDTSFAVDYAVAQQLSAMTPAAEPAEALAVQSVVPMAVTPLAADAGDVKPIALPPEETPTMQRRTDLTRAPAPVEEWVGRADFLAALDEDWANPQCHLTGVIGFGGEGKSSLARQWIETLLKPDATQPRPDGVFWWGFYEQPNVEEFFDAIFKYLDLQDIDPAQLISVEAKAETIRAMRGRYLFVLDGLEVLQEQAGDDYGLLKDRNLRTFLRIFADGNHESFCLLTSRFPVLDLIDFTTYHQREIGALDESAGVALLKKIRVKGSEKQLTQVVKDWGGYALSLRWIGTYLVDTHGGNVKRLREIPPPDQNEPVYERLQKVLQSYDGYITQAEREFLKVFSLFRLPTVAGQALKAVFAESSYIPPPLPQPDPITKLLRRLKRLWERLLGRRQSALVRLREKLNVPVAQLDSRRFDAMIRRLVAYRIVEAYPDSQYYSLHPLIRAHYAAQQQQESSQWVKNAHRRIADFYQQTTFVPQQPALADLTPLIEAVHHCCQAGDYDQAYKILQDRIYQGYPRRVLINELGAYDTALTLLQDFFPERDTTLTPQVSSLGDQRWILNEIGFCLMSLGRLAEAPPFYERYVTGNINAEDWHNTSIGYLNLASLYAYLGDLSASATAAESVLTYARRVDHEQQKKQNESNSLAYQGWAAHLQGNLDAAQTAFQQAEQLEQQINSNMQYLYSLLGIQHAEHLRRRGGTDYARRITEANQVICEQNRWSDNLSQCHRLLGDLDATHNPQTAQEHYTEALRLARSISKKNVLIEALLGRGRWAARRGEGAAAASDLEEALSYAVEGGYRIYEADIRVALAWMHRAQGNFGAAQREAERAQRMSQAMGYYWGQQDAAEVLTELAAVAGA